MTIKEFAEKCGKGSKTVRTWIEKGYLPGANADEDYIPDFAREPYTLARAKKGQALIKSILKACNDEKAIFPEIFHISVDHFNVLITSLIQEGLITAYKVDLATYYVITNKGSQELKTFKTSDWINLAGVITTIFPTLMQIFSNVLK